MISKLMYVDKQCPHAMGHYVCFHASQCQYPICPRGAEMSRLKNCWACDISSGAGIWRWGGGGGTMNAKGARFLGRLGGMLPHKYLKI